MNYESYLSHKGLRVFDPYEQSGLLPQEKQEPEKETLEIINRYHIGKEKVFCHICGKKLHNNGYTGSTGHGELILFGSKCATDYFDHYTLRLAHSVFEAKEKLATSEFKVHLVKGTAKSVVEWLETHDNLIISLKNAWDEISSKHKSDFEEIFQHLERNHNRLTETFVEEASSVSRAVGVHNRKVDTRIVLAIRNPVPWKDIWNFRQHTQVVNEFAQYLLDLNEISDDKVILDIDKKLRTNFFKSVDAIDGVIAFSIEIFHETTLGKIGELSPPRWGRKQFQHLSFS